MNPCSRISQESLSLERGSRLSVPAELGEVTNGPPSSGAGTSDFYMNITESSSATSGWSMKSLFQDGHEIISFSRKTSDNKKFSKIYHYHTYKFLGKKFGSDRFGNFFGDKSSVRPGNSMEKKIRFG